MKKLRLITKTLLVAAMLLGGGNCVWAYTLPDGYQIKTVFIGANNGDGTVASDVFNYESVPATWVAQDNNAAVAIGNVTTIANVAVGSTPENQPTYVDGKTLQLTVSGTNWTQHWARYTLADAVTTGKLIFRADMYQANSPTFIRFLDENGGELLKLGFNNGSGDKYYQYYVNGNSTGSNCDMHTTYRSYHGFSIEDLVLDMSNGTVSFYLDYINTNSNNQRAQVTNTKNISFGSGKAVKYFEIGSTVNGSQTVHFDNIQFYHVAEAGKNNYEIYAKAGDTNLRLLASGQKATNEEYSVTGLPLVLKYNNQYYVLDDATVTNYATQTYTMGDSDETKYINYTLDKTIVYFEEGESLCSSKYLGNYSGGYAASYRASGDMSHLNKFNSTVISETGVYKADIYVTGGITNGRAYGVYKVENEALTTVGSISFPRNSSASTGLYSTSNFLVESGTTLYTGGTSNTLDIDYLIIRKLYTVTDPNQIVGAINYSTNFMDDHTDLTISQGQTIKVNFKNHGNGESNWFNWLLRLSGTTGVDHTLRADNFVIGDDGSTVSTRSITEDGAAFDNWTNFLAEMQDASVEMTISYTAAGMFSVTATSTGANHTYVHNFAYNDAKSGNINLELGVEKAWLEILSVENTAVPATIAASGYTTLSSAYGLDFSGVEGLTAYVVSNITKSAVTISSVDEMPANSGVVLKGTAGATYSIPVKAGATFTGTTNKLQAAVTATVVDDGSAYILKGGQFCLLTGAATEADRTIPAGKAYLLATDVPNEARTLGFVFDDELTGINNVNVNDNVNGEFYDLQGRRVAAPQKGMYIMNGRKVIVK